MAQFYSNYVLLSRSQYAALLHNRNNHNQCYLGGQILLQNNIKN